MVVNCNISVKINIIYLLAYVFNWYARFNTVMFVFFIKRISVPHPLVDCQLINK